MIDLTGKSVLISGGSRGIGAATAVLFARAGADVAFTYTKHRKDAAQVVERVEALGRNALAIQGNVAKEDHVRRFVQTTVGCFGKVDILVNNAGIWTYGAIGKMNRKVWDDTVDINQTGTFLLCNAVVPHMRKRKYGRIVNVSSTAGQRGESHHSHYAATKGAIIAFTKSLAAELGSQNILVNCVAPGWVDTDMSAGVFRNRHYKERIRRTIPRGTIATAEEIAGPILFLASDLAANIAGEVLNVNGGSVLCG